MRWLFLFVFALNLTYIAWGLSQPPADPYANVRPLKNVATIVLLSEVESSDSMVAEAKPVEIFESEAVSDSSERQGETEVVEVQEIPSNIFDDAPAVAVTEIGDTSEVPAETPVEPSAAVKPEKKPLPQKTQPAETVIAQDSTVCYSLGPFRDIEKLRRLTRDIKSYVVSAEFRGNEENEQSLYWVYIKPEKDRKAAIATGKRLKAKKIKDFYVIREGDKINGLSLGYFRSKDGATGLVKKVDKLGFDVVLEPVYKTYTVYWLDYQLAEGVKVPKTVFDKYIGGAKKDKVKLTGRDCGN